MTTHPGRNSRLPWFLRSSFLISVLLGIALIAFRELLFNVPSSIVLLFVPLFYMWPVVAYLVAWRNTRQRWRLIVALNLALTGGVSWLMLATDFWLRRPSLEWTIIIAQSITNLFNMIMVMEILARLSGHFTDPAYRHPRDLLFLRPPVDASLVPSWLSRRVLGFIAITPLIMAGLLVILAMIGSLPCSWLDITMQRSGCVMRLYHGSFGLNQMALSADGVWLASANGFNGTVRLWRVADGAQVRVFTHPNARTVALSPDGRLLASGDWDGEIRLWHSSDGVLLHTLVLGEWVRELSFSPDGTLVAAAPSSLMKSVLLWKVENGQRVHQLEGRSRALFSPDGSLLVTGSPDNKGMQIWRTSDWSLRNEFKRWITAFSPDGSLFADSGNVDYALHEQSDGSWVQDKNPSARIRLYRTSDSTEVQALTAPATGHHEWIDEVAFSPDGTLLVMAGGDKVLRVWRIADGTLLVAQTLHDRINSLAVTPDGTVIVALNDGAIQFWRLW